jgi:hypothetical protein
MSSNAPPGKKHFAEYVLMAGAKDAEVALTDPEAMPFCSRLREFVKYSAPD